MSPQCLLRHGRLDQYSHAHREAYLYILAGSNIPNFACAIDRSTNAKLTRVVKLCAWYLTMMTRKRIYASSTSYVPYFDRMIERSSDNSLTLSVEIQTDYFCSMTSQRMKILAAFNVPQSSSVVHRTGCNNCSLRIECQTDNFGRVSTEGMIQLSRFRIPKLACLIEGSGYYFIATYKIQQDQRIHWTACKDLPVRIIECDGVDNIFMPFQREQLVTALSIPYFTCSIIASRYKLITRLVKRAICKR